MASKALGIKAGGNVVEYSSFRAMGDIVSAIYSSGEAVCKADFKTAGLKISQAVAAAYGVPVFESYNRFIKIAEANGLIETNK
jgi:hypothetical protein